MIEDCVASMYGEDLHVLGLENVKRCLGYVLSASEFKEKSDEHPDHLLIRIKTEENYY